MWWRLQPYVMGPAASARRARGAPAGALQLLRAPRAAPGRGRVWRGHQVAGAGAHVCRQLRGRITYGTARVRSGVVPGDV